MKLRSRKVKLLFILLFFTAFTALALELFTSHGLFKKDDAEKESGNISFPDTLIKGKPPVSDTVFTNLLQQADILLKSNKFESCLAELERARKIRPADKVVGVKIVQVRGIISENNKKRSDFQASLVSGDAAFQKKDYLNAKAYYQLALNLIPTDSLGREKLKKTMELIRSQKASNTLFDVAVANADRLFAAGDYERARAEYENASHIIPSEQYPKQKINEIVKIMVDQQMQEGLYGEAIRNADQLYTDRNWQPALLEYQNASKIRPQEKYPKDRIAELLPLIAAQRSKDEAYIKLIASADQLLSGQSYIAARKDYESASKIKPDQIYPKNKIAGIDALLVKIGRTQKDYEQYISLADSFYIDKNFTGARDYYTLASGVKPGENYPKEMLEKVKPMIAGQEANLSAAARAKETEKKIAELALLRKLEDDYAAALKKGDSLLALTQYAEAKTAFTLAATLKPTESYPKEKLVVINTALADLAKQEAIDKENLAKHQALEKETLAKQQAIDKQYIAAITAADKLLVAKSYSEAKVRYNTALALKPGEVYPAGKITEIDKTLAELAKQKALDDEYGAALASGETLFKAKSYEQARAGYQKATVLKPEEALPKRRIASIDSIGRSDSDKQLAELARLKKIEEDYKAEIKQGDSLLGLTQYAGAKTAFTQAATLKPVETYPKEKLALINTVLADLAKQQAIDKANLARQQALEKENLAKQQALDKQYLAAITAADKLLAAKSYSEAKAQYNAALALKPGEVYPAGKIAEIDKTLADLAKQKTLDDEYAAALASGETLFKAKSYEQARAGYQKATVLKPEEALPKRRIASIDSIGRSESDKQLAELARLKKLDDEYKAAVKKGDSLLALTQYAGSKTAFTLAATLKPTETYPKEKLAVINTAQVELEKRQALEKENLARQQALEKENLAKQQALDKQYLAAITAADKLLAAKSYSEAKAQYNAALALKPGEVYPAGKIAEIDKTLADLAKQKTLDDEYAAALASGETLFKAKSYEQARAGYQKATVLKPEEALPKRRIASIDSIARSESDKQLAELARLKKLDEDYKAAVKQGDSLLAAKQYAEAKIAFTQASTLKPSEIYSKEKLAVINTAQVELEKRQAQEKENLARQQALEKENLAKQQALDKQYQDAVTEADKLLTGHSLGGAKAKYTAALTIKPAEAYPKAKIAEIDKIVTDSVQKQKALDQQYAGFLRNADQLLLSKTYSQAKSEYAKASELKPSEEYPKIKIGEIEKALADLAARKTRDSAYAVVIANADKLLAAKSFEQAKAEYQKAFEYKADDLYLKTKITEIDKTVADIAQQKATIESRYKASVARADQLLASKSYELAKTEYTAALGIKAGEQYPQDKIKEINTILAELKAKEEAYKASVAKADQMLLEKKWEEARTEYENALTIKPGEQYAKNKVEEINNKLMELQGRKKTFDDLVLKGDNSLGGKDYGKAREFFQQATGLFPEEAYPRERLKRVNSVIDSIYRANKGKYDIAIAEADKFYNGFEFDRAIDAYTNASVLLPMESYPQEMIARIHRTISENAISDVMNSAVTIRSNEEKRFPFTPVNIASRKDNFIYIKLRNLSGKPFSVLLRYGKDKQPSGGVVIRNLSIDGKVNERLISVREQDVWYRVDNDYISLYPQGGDIEVTFIQVSKAH